MTDQGPFVPPSGALPPRPALPPVPSGPPDPAATAGPAATLPPPTGSPLPPAMPTSVGAPPSPPHPRRRWVVPVVAGAVALLLGLGALGVWGAVQVGTYLRELPVSAPPPAAPPAAPIAGDPGRPVAEDPLECVGCFTYPDATTLRLGLDAYRAIGLTTADGHTLSTYAGEEHELSSAGWTDTRGEPAECYFAFPQSPLAHTTGALDAAGSDDRVHYPSWHTDADEYYWLTEGVRLFDDSAAASAYLAGLETAVAGCDAYSLPTSGWAATVTPAAALDLPPSVAAYGWVESGGGNRFYAVDLQRGNLVLRITLNSDGSGPDEAAFRMFAQAYAEKLAGLEPTG